MRKTIITSLALLASVCASGQKIRVVEMIDHEHPLQSSLGKDWAEIDSLVITERFVPLSEASFDVIRKCCNEGRLSGIDLRMVANREIPAYAFSSQQSSSGADVRPGGLRYVTLPAGLKSIGAGAFEGTLLRSIDIPRTVTSIGSRSFAGCPSLRSVTLRGNSAVTDVSADAFSGSSSDAVLNVFSDVSGYYASSDAWKGFKRIHPDAGLFRTLAIHLDGSRTAEEMLGSDSYDVDSLVVTGLPTKDDFNFIRSLSVNGRLYGLNLLDCDIDEIESGSFNLGLCRIPSIVLPNGLKRIGSYLGDSWIEHVSFPPSLHEIGRSGFRYCRSLKGPLVFPEGLTRIGDDAFIGCTQTGSIYLPSTLDEIGTNSFFMPYTDAAGHDVYVNRMTPPRTTVDDGYTYDDGVENYDGPFGFCNSSAGRGWRLFVPLGARAAYVAHPHWKHFGELVVTPDLTGGPNAVEGVTAPDNGNGISEVYTLSGRLVWRGSGTPSLQKGLYIVKENGRAVKRIVE